MLILHRESRLRECGGGQQDGGRESHQGFIDLFHFHFHFKSLLIIRLLCYRDGFVAGAEDGGPGSIPIHIFLGLDGLHGDLHLQIHFIVRLHGTIQVIDVRDSRGVQVVFIEERFRSFRFAGELARRDSLRIVEVAVRSMFKSRSALW